MYVYIYIYPYKTNGPKYLEIPWNHEGWDQPTFSRPWRMAGDSRDASAESGRLRTSGVPDPNGLPTVGNQNHP